MVQRPVTPITDEQRTDAMAWVLSDLLAQQSRYRGAPTIFTEAAAEDSPAADWGGALELLDLRGTTTDTGGAVVEVRLTPQPAPGADAHDDDRAAAASCYSIAVRQEQVEGPVPQRISCEGRTALVRPERGLSPRIPADAPGRLGAALGHGPGAPTPTLDHVRTALAGLVGPPATVEVADVGGVIGVAVFTSVPSRDCLLGRRTGDGVVEVWRPDPVQVAPGESSCDAVTAAAGGAQTTP